MTSTGNDMTERALRETADVSDLSDDDLVALVDAAAARSANETGWTGREVKALEELRRRNPPVGDIDPDSIEQITVLRCVECEHLMDESDWDASPLYECGRCGERFNRDNSADGDSSRCASCNVFAAKVAERSCPECETGEMEEVAGYLYEGEVYVPENEYDSPLDTIHKALAVRAVEAREEADRLQRKQDAESRRDSLWSETPEKPAGEIAEGDIVLLRWPVIRRSPVSPQGERRQVVIDGEPQWEYQAIRVGYVYLTKPGAKFGDPGVSVNEIGDPDTVRYGGTGGMTYSSPVSETVHVLTEQQADEGGFLLW